MIKDIFKRVFSIDTESSNYTIINILGVRIRHTKKACKEQKQIYLNMNCPVNELPPADGMLRKIQFAELKMMKIFDELCKENELEYWLDFGNLLGAVRHKGFIPWDDDVDFGMLRDDYEKFIKLFQNGIPKYKDIYLEFNNNGKNRCFIKVKHRYIQDLAIDIFPYDLYFKKTTYAEKLAITKKIRKIIDRKLYKFLYSFFANHPDKMRKRFFTIRDNEILNNNFGDKKSEPSVFYGIDYNHGYDNYFFDYDKIFPLKKFQFEDTEFPCPNDSDFVLTQVFGNYMSVPNDCYPTHTHFNDTKLEADLDKFIGEKYE